MDKKPHDNNSEFTATNSTISLPIIGAMSGTDTVEAKAGAALTIPRILTVNKTTDIKLPGITDNGANSGIRVNGVASNGTLGAEIDDTLYQIKVVSGQDSTITIQTKDESNNPTIAAEYDHFIIKYNRNVTQNAIKIVNRSDAFPKTVKLTLKVLIVDPCEADTIRAAYVVFPSFQPSPELSISFSTDATIDFTGRLQTSYCGTEKILYEIMVCSDDEEETA